MASAVDYRKFAEECLDMAERMITDPDEIRRRVVADTEGR
jgi:hypothetical protein